MDPLLSNQAKIQKGPQRHLKPGRKLASPSPGDEIVITGMAGRFADANDVYEFKHNLLNKISMVSQDNRRWKNTNPEIPHPSGKINFLEKFDAGFFGIHSHQAQQMDPHTRQLLERAFEAILDAGFHPNQLKGSRTGVYIGCSYSETDTIWLFDKHESPSFAATGVHHSTLAQWISYCLGLEGQSYVTSTACSTSAQILYDAYLDIRNGRCEAALVGASNLCLHPMVTLALYRLGILGSDGQCKSFDARANGYVRSEGIAVIFLQKAANARRIYSQLYHIKTSFDGFKPEGLQQPSLEMQKELITEVLEECNVTAEDLDYFEAHGTGTYVGDYIESKAIDECVCSNRTTPLYVATTKPVLGHTESTSGLSSMIKVIIGMQNNCLLPNNNYLYPRENLCGFHEGRMIVPTKLIPWPTSGKGFTALNNFGYGGTNGHIILKRFSNHEHDDQKPQDDLPRLVCVSGRTQYAVVHILNDLKNRSFDVQYVRLLHEVFRDDISGHSYRAYSIMSKTREITRSTTQYCENNRPLCLVFGCPNKKLLALGRCLFTVPLFKSAVEMSNTILASQQVDIEKIIHQTSFTNPVDATVGTIAIQVAFVDVLRALEITDYYTLGYSVGELSAAYADGILTLEQTLLAGYHIGSYLAELSRKQPITSSQMKIAYSGIPDAKMEIDSNTKSDGIAMATEPFEKQWINELYNINTKNSETENHFLTLNLLHTLMPPKLKQPSSRWLATVSQTDEFFLEMLFNNILTAKTFQEIKPLIPSESVVLTFIQETDNIPNIIALTSVEDDSKKYYTNLLCTLGRLYEMGHNPKLEKLYPIVKWPVSIHTPMISPLIKWDHKDDWFVPHFEVQKKLKYGKRTVTFNLKMPEYASLAGHVLDGRNIIPAMGYLSLVWETLAMVMDIEMTEMDVLFENVEFHMATVIPANDDVELTITVHKISGRFLVEDQGETVVTGKIYTNVDSFVESLITTVENSSDILLTTDDIYTGLKLRGYDYKGVYRSLKQCNLDVSKALLEWKNDWIAFVDNMLQLQILKKETKNLYVPIGIERLAINAKTHLRFATELLQDYILPVSVCQKMGIIKSGGIEIRGLTTQSIPRTKTVEQPLLEAYKFVPNNAKLSTAQSVNVNIQLVLENIHDLEIRVVEVVDKMYCRQPLGSMISQVLDNYPLMKHEVIVLSNHDLSLTDVTVDNRKLSKEKDMCSLIVITNGLITPKAMEEALYMLKNTGFILSRENSGFSENAAVPQNLTVVSIHQTEIETLVLLREIQKVAVPIILDISNNTKITDFLSTIQPTSDQEFLILSQTTQLNGVLGLVTYLRPKNLKVKYFFIMDKAPKFDLRDNFCLLQYQKGLTINVFTEGKWGTYRHFPLESETKTQCQNIVAKGNLCSLFWTEGTSVDQKLKTNCDTIQVYYASINSRDIMVASGKINTDLFVKNTIGQENVLGLEFSGRDLTGKRVMGLVEYGALSSIVTPDLDLTWEVPNEWSLEDAATVPAAYIPALYGLVTVAKIKPNQFVLIHVGTDVIGYAAVNVALYYKCKIFVTVQNEEERSFIRKQFPEMPENHIRKSFTSIKQIILRKTLGHGVDVILYAENQENLQEPSGCLASGGTFLILTKNETIGRGMTDPEAFSKKRFHGINLDLLISTCSPIKKNLSKIFTDELKLGCIKPLKRNVFKHDELVEAFRYQSSHRHTRKVIINFRPEEPNRLQKPEIKLYSGLSRTYCNADYSYIFFGELNGFGLEVIERFILRGARKLLVTKNELETGYQVSRIRSWHSSGANIKTLTKYVKTEEDCNFVINQAAELGPVGGIIVMSTVTDIAGQGTNLNEIYDLVKAADATSRKMCPLLKHFIVLPVLFDKPNNSDKLHSEVTNAVLEQICEQRKKYCYPALAVRWDVVRNVDFAAENQIEEQGHSILKYRIAFCLDTLDTFLTQNEAVVSIRTLPKKVHNVTKERSIIDTIKDLIGLKDIKTISNQTKLSELGLDSILVAEARQTLEKEFLVAFTANDVRTMTFQRLEDLSMAEKYKDKKR